MTTRRKGEPAGSLVSRIAAMQCLKDVSVQIECAVYHAAAVRVPALKGGVDCVLSLAPLHEAQARVPGPGVVSHVLAAHAGLGHGGSVALV